MKLLPKLIIGTILISSAINVNARSGVHFKNSKVEMMIDGKRMKLFVVLYETVVMIQTIIFKHTDTIQLRFDAYKFQKHECAGSAKTSKTLNTDEYVSFEMSCKNNDKTMLVNWVVGSLYTNIQTLIDLN